MMNLMREKVSQFIIYALHNYDSKYVYVGKSSSGLQRPREHMQTANLVKYAHTPRVKWIKSLRARDCEPEIVVLEDLSTRGALNEAEQFHIAYFRSIGIPLLNCTDGGDGGIGYQPTDEQLAKVAAASKTRAETAGGREFLSKIAKNYWANPAAREEQRIRKLGNKLSPEARAKVTAAVTGQPKSVEHRAALSVAATAAMKLRWQDPVYREQQQRIQKEAAARKSEAVKKCWRDPAYRAQQALSRGRRSKNSGDDPK